MDEAAARSLAYLHPLPSRSRGQLEQTLSTTHTQFTRIRMALCTQSPLLPLNYPEMNARTRRGPRPNLGRTTVGLERAPPRRQTRLMRERQGLRPAAGNMARVMCGSGSAEAMNTSRWSK